MRCREIRRAPSRVADVVRRSVRIGPHTSTRYTVRRPAHSLLVIGLILVSVAQVCLCAPVWAAERDDAQNARPAAAEAPPLRAPLDDETIANRVSTTNHADPVAIGMRLSRTTCHTSWPPCLLLKLEYAASEAAPQERPPLNIALVLDNSNSMAEARKLPYTLEAAHVVIENLTDRDLLSLIAFNNEAIVLAGAGRVVNKAFLLHRLSEVEPENNTNLGAGLLEGIAQVSAHSEEGQVRQVLLLTDGRANCGETSPAALTDIAEQAKRRGIGVSTFGVGSDFNERLLSDLATAAGGRYVYIGAPEQIPTAFQSELRGLLDVVAQNAVLDLVVQGGEITKVYGQVIDEPAASHRLVIGDVRATDRGFILAELGATRAGRASGLQADVRVEFDDPKAGTRVTRSIGVRVPAGGAPEDSGLVLLAAILDAVESADLAAQGLDTARYRTARRAFERRYAEARSFAMRTRDQELLNQTFVLKHFMDELVLAEKSGLLHGHREAQAKLQKESHYLQYLLTHHRTRS